MPGEPALAPEALNARRPARPLRLGLIGAGTISQSIHLPALRRLRPKIELVAVCDASPSRADSIARQEGVEPEHDAARLIARDDLDALLLATPGAHGELTRAALLAGRHVLAEKPLTLTQADARELGALAADRGLVLQVGYMKMYDPLVADARAQLEGLEPRLVRVTVLHPADGAQTHHLRIAPLHEDSDPATIDHARAYDDALTAAAVGVSSGPLGTWYRDVLHGSVIHELSLLRALGLGLPQHFDCVRLWPWPLAGEPPCLLAGAQLPGGAQLLLSWNWLPDHPEYSEEVAIFARNGRVRLEVAPPYLIDARSSLYVERGDGELRVVTQLTRGRDSGFVAQLVAFVASVREGAPVLSDAAGAAADTRCLQQIAITAGAALGGPALGGEAAG